MKVGRAKINLDNWATSVLKDEIKKGFENDPLNSTHLAVFWNE